MKEFSIQIDNGDIAVRDYGGELDVILLVHGTGHNLEVWKPLAELLKDNYRIITFDTRGHGKTSLDSDDATQYWKDIGQIIEKLGIHPVLLIGHSTGGFSVSAYTVWTNSKIPVMILDGFVLDRYVAIADDHPSKIPKEMLWNLFRYGWRTSEQEMDEYIESQISKSEDLNDFNYGVSKTLIRDFLRRCFYQISGKWLRRPTFEEIETVGNPDKDEPILPDVNLYYNIDSPMAFVVAKRGFYYQRKEDILKIVSENKLIYFFELDSSHNLHMTNPVEVKEIIFQFMDLVRHK